MPVPLAPGPPVPPRPPAARRPDGAAEEVLAWAAYDPAGPGPAARARRRERASVALTGSVAVVDALVPLLAAAGVGRLACDRPVPGTTTSRTAADLLVLVAEHAADPVVADGVQADGVPHLSVVLRDTDALVGPLVLPGLSACLRCLDRWRTDADPRWPAVRTGLTGAPPRPVDAATASVLAGLVALQVLAHLDGGRAGAVGATLELLLPEGRVRYRWWRPHPACGCVDLPVP